MLKPTLIFATCSLMLFACGSDSIETANGETTEETVEEILAVTSDYQLNTTESKADWERTLDQKPTKQKVKLFGKMVDVELGEVKLNSNGTVTLKEGGLTTTDEILTEASVVFDMASFKFAKEKDQGLFDVTTHPNSTLMLTDFTDTSAKGKLTIQGASKEMDVELTTTKSENGYLVKGTFVANTLDFPLREKVKEKDINKDEIKVIFELKYDLK